MHSLTDLILAENEIDEIQNFRNLPALKNLTLSQNSIEKIPDDLPVLPVLYHLNLADNKIADFRDLKKL